MFYKGFSKAILVRDVTENLAAIDSSCVETNASENYTKVENCKPQKLIVN